jgi:EAL domain-containing protein (putative c-di-GMP-specific phosphodiesterase class I)
MSLGLVGKHSKRRAVEPRRFDFVRGTVILLLAAARLSLAHADTGAGSYTDMNAEHSYSGITGLLPKTFGEPAPAAETSVRFGAACSLPISLSLIPASLAGPDASPIFHLNRVCDSLRDAFAESSENTVSRVSEPPLARLEWSSPSQTFLFTLERRLDSSASGRSPGNNENAVAHVEDRPEDQPVELAEDRPTADDSTCLTSPPCNAHPSSAVSQDEAPPAERTGFATPSITAGPNAFARVWSRLLWPLLIALVAAVGWLLFKRWTRYDKALIRAARTGLRRREFHLEYQPVVSLRQGRCVGVEALLRWDNVAFGSLGPDHYMPFIEKSSLIGRLTQFVLSTATREISAIPDARSLYVGINMSAAQLLSPELMEDLREAIRGSRPTVILELDKDDVTETGPQLARVMTSARALGVQFALAGIGPPFTDLRSYSQLNFEMVKVSRDIFELTPYERSRHFESIVSMAHRLDAIVVAEGVETAAQHAAVRTTQAEFGQGFFYGRALSIGRLAAFLASGGGATILAWRIRKYS